MVPPIVAKPLHLVSGSSKTLGICLPMGPRPSDPVVAVVALMMQRVLEIRF